MVLEEFTKIDNSPVSASPADPLAVLKNFIRERNASKGNGNKEIQLATFVIEIYIII